MKIQFIIIGWHYNQLEYYEDLKYLLDSNSHIDVFWCCHKPPIDFIKNNFTYHEFDNHGLEWGGYQQSIDYLNLNDDTILFCMHDDLIVKDWSFITQCIDLLNNGKKVIGNGVNYPLVLDPNAIAYNEKTFIDYVKPQCQYMFNTIQFSYTIRGSFLCTIRKYLRDINDFEVIWEPPVPGQPIGTFGNVQQQLLGYKLTKVYGLHGFAYLSSTYQDSNFIYECARGK